MRYLPKVLFGVTIVLALQAPSQAGLITNGDFETGDFTGWTLTDPLDPSVVSSAGTIGGITYVPHGGTYFAALGDFQAVGDLTQTIGTSPGQMYTLTYWMGSDGLQPNDFGVTWDSTILVPTAPVSSTVKSGTVKYNSFSFTVTGTGSDTLSFAERSDNGFIVLDDISLTPATSGSTPEPASLALLASGMAALAGYGWRRCRRRLA